MEYGGGKKRVEGRIVERNEGNYCGLEGSGGMEKGEGRILGKGVEKTIMVKRVERGYWRGVEWMIVDWRRME